MAFLYRPTQTKPMPQGAEVFTRKGERFARWKNPNGKNRSAKLTTTEEGGDRIIVESLFWRCRYRDGAGILCDVPTRCRDEDAAQSVMKDLVRRTKLVKANVMSAAEDAVADHSETPLAKHFDGYIAHLQAKGNDPHRISQVRARLDRVAAECGFGLLSKMDAGELERWLVVRKDGGMGASTRNGYREVLVGFGNWCRRTRRLIANPFTDVPLADVKSDRRHVRRSLTEEELIWLLAVARKRPLAEHGRQSISTGKTKGKRRNNWHKSPLTYHTLDAAEAKARQLLADYPNRIAVLEQCGRERALIYKTLVLTGLRKGELASLTVGQLDLESNVAYAVLNAADEKNRQGSEIALRADLAADVRSWLADKLTALQEEARWKLQPMPAKLPPETPLFYLPTGLIRILDRDLLTAGIARMAKDKDGKPYIDKRDERGRVIDLHALRVTFGTHLSMSGVPLRTAQAAMRHSKPDLTANVYTDPKLLDVMGALNGLPMLSLNPSPPQSAKATGTDSTTQMPVSAIALPIALASSKLSTKGDYADHETRLDAMAGTKGGTHANARPVNKKGSLSIPEHEPLPKRAKGVEPSTFTLAK